MADRKVVTKQQEVVADRVVDQIVREHLELRPRVDRDLKVVSPVTNTARMCGVQFDGGSKAAQRLRKLRPVGRRIR